MVKVELAVTIPINMGCISSFSRRVLQNQRLILHKYCSLTHKGRACVCLSKWPRQIFSYDPLWSVLLTPTLCIHTCIIQIPKERNVYKSFPFCFLLNLSGLQQTVVYFYYYFVWYTSYIFVYFKSIIDHLKI